jgi:hypothetical protein
MRTGAEGTLSDGRSFLAAIITVAIYGILIYAAFSHLTT